MSESESEVAEQAPVEFDPSRDFARMRRIGSWHFAAVMAALTLWGTADAWAMQSNWLLAHVVALGNALVAGVVLGSIAHEWGHFSGARLSRAASPVLETPARFFFMFNFDMQSNSTGQFLSMSWGGPLANWLLVVLLFTLVPLSTPSQALLIATVAGIAVNVSLFEVPVILRTRTSGAPQEELAAQLQNPGLQTLPGVVGGALVWLLLAS